MEDRSTTTMLESSGEDSMLIETAKGVVKQERRSGLENEEDFFLVSEHVMQYSEAHDAKEATSHKRTVTEDTLASWTDLCRTCANVSDHFIPIFEGEGADHDLLNKILKYLPIQVSENDTLPLQLCYHCAATLLAWHKLIEGCLNAEKRLQEIQDTLENKRQYYTTPLDNLEVPTSISTTTTTIVSNTASAKPNQQVNDKSGITEEINKLDRSCGVWAPFRVFLDTQSIFRKPMMNRKQCTDPMPVVHMRKPNAAEDCDSVWIAVMDTTTTTMTTTTMTTTLDQTSPGTSEQLQNNDPLNLNPLEVRETPVVASPRCPVTTRNHEWEREPDSGRTAAVVHEEMRARNRIPDNDDPPRSDDDDDDDGNDDDDDDSNDRTKTRNDTRLDSELVSKSHRQCAECGKCFKLKDSYLRHMRIHKDERPFTCHVCGKQFRDSGGLSRHLRDVHAKLKNFTCDLCGRSFASKATRDDHRRTHTGERPYVCDSCGKAFKSKASLYIHSKLHTDEFPHACSYCTKRFRRRQEVLAHVTTHTGEKKHTCDVCAKKFRVKSELARHKLIHSEDKPFVCVKCGLAFRQKRYLNNHIKSRHRERTNDRGALNNKSFTGSISPPLTLST